MSEEHYEDLNLRPPERGFELYRYKNVEEMRTRGWSGLYWARKTEAGDYEIRAITMEEEGYSYPGGVFSEEAFETYYEKAKLVSAATSSSRSGGMKRCSAHGTYRYPLVEYSHYGGSTMSFLSELRADDERRHSQDRRVV